MDWSTVVEWGLAATIAVGAKREMGAFRKMFKETLDKLVATQETHGKEIASIKAGLDETRADLADLADALYEGDDDDTNPGPVN